LGAWDTDVALWLNGLVAGHAALVGLADLLANRAIALLGALAVLLAVWPGAGRSGRRRAALAAALATAAALVLGFGLEHLLARPRPFVALVISPLFPHAADSSFPSDHTLAGFALATPFLLASRRLAPALAGSGLLILALLIGLARVAAAIHYPSDILGSALLGVGLAAGALALVRFGTGRLPQPFRVWIGASDADAPLRHHLK
jgi:undecaprenyl-diphosphatase